MAEMRRFANSPIGRLIPIEVSSDDRRYQSHAFVPDPLPASIKVSTDVAIQLENAMLALGRLDGAARRLPNPWLLARPIIRREALSSSSLEGTVSTMSALLTSELLEETEDLATAEVRNFVRAMEAGTFALEKLPVSMRLVRNLHATLLTGVRGDSYMLGEVRGSQNWIGPPGTSIDEAQFVPPPPGEILIDGLSSWEKWIHNPRIPLLIRVALGHYQFETLHPFDDGNGRLGRLVAILMLLESDTLPVPLLDISTWLENQRDQYIEHLRSVSETGNFDPWLLFFLRCISEQSGRALSKTTRLLTLEEQMVTSLRRDNVRGIALHIAESLIGYPYLTVRSAADLTGKTYQGASNAVKKLCERDILVPLPGEWYPQVYYAPEVYGIINEP